MPGLQLHVARRLGARTLLRGGVLNADPQRRIALFRLLLMHQQHMVLLASHHDDEFVGT
jgi:hypothetical protein